VRTSQPAQLVLTYPALPTVETDFKQALAALKVCRKHLPRDTDLRGILKTQRAMFGTFLQNVLLTDNISLQETQNMAINKDHLMWSHETLHSHLSSHLAASTEACYEVIKNIKEKLASRGCCKTQDGIPLSALES
jgi:predicted DsbA family dithiol-disulfide isomerase